MKRIFIIAALLFYNIGLFAQSESNLSIDVVEYNLENGLHVIICQDTTSPIVNVGVMYHVGSKNERADRTGFAHLFEHLLFTGTKNIPEGELENYLRASGGYSNANTSADRTYYYTILPSNQLNLGLWIESERMLHPIITPKAIDRERNVVKEESRQRFDTNPLGRAPEKMLAVDYKEYPYKWPVIGSMEHLDAASLEDVQEFFKKYYVPNNACLVLTGDVNIAQVKKDIEAYFGRIPKGKPVIQPQFCEKEFGGEVVTDSIVGIENPHMFISYKTCPETDKDATIIDIIFAHISLINDGPLDSIPELNKEIIKIATTKEMYEKAGNLWIRSTFADSASYECVVNAVDKVMAAIVQNGIDSLRLSRIKYSFESSYADIFYDMPFLADMLAISYLEWGNTLRINGLIPAYMAVTNDDIKRVAGKYFIPENRNLMIIYPKK